jgi:hypothetical protein
MRSKGEHIGTVEAPDRERAEAVAIKQFDLDRNPAQPAADPGAAIVRAALWPGLILKRRAVALILSQQSATEIEMRVFAVVAIITSLAVPAFAAEDPAKAEANKAEEQKKKENVEIERAYKDTLKKTTREQPVKKADPWGGAR